MLGTLNPGEEAQLRQTIEMFEVITQSQPQDYQSLEILKEAYLKLNMEAEVVSTSKRIAQAYVQLGQLSSAILEYETILQRHPKDAEALAAMAQIEPKAVNLGAGAAETEPPATSDTTITSRTKKGGDKAGAQSDFNDGRETMRKIFVEAKHITDGDFQACWPKVDPTAAPAKTIDPFIQNLAERQIVPLDKSLRLLADRSRLAYIALERYDVEQDLMKAPVRPACLRWCVVPIDRVSKTIIVATANPYNHQAAIDLEHALKQRLQWCLASPVEMLRILSKPVR